LPNLPENKDIISHANTIGTAASCCTSMLSAQRFRDLDQLLTILLSQGRENSDQGSFKTSGENQHWSRQLTVWRNFRERDFSGQCL